MTRRRPVGARELVRFLSAQGFVQVRQRGSHKFFRHADGRTATVPDHKGEDLGRGIVAQILRDMDSSPKEFFDWLTR